MVPTQTAARAPWSLFPIVVENVRCGICHLDHFSATVLRCKVHLHCVTCFQNFPIFPTETVPIAPPPTTPALASPSLLPLWQRAQGPHGSGVTQPSSLRDWHFSLSTESARTLQPRAGSGWLLHVIVAVVLTRLSGSCWDLSAHGVSHVVTPACSALSPLSLRSPTFLAPGTRAPMRI